VVYREASVPAKALLQLACEDDASLNQNEPSHT
jgi:hypothetical protein